MAENKIIKIDTNTYIIDGGLAIYDLEKLFEINIPEGDYDTVSGYLIEKIPREKEKTVIETEDMIYKIEKVKNKKIKQVKACKK